jgi:hypothetical protein
MQNAFNAGPLHRSLPTITAGEPVVGILLGIAVFGDRVSLTPGSLAMQAAGLFALVVGVVLVARAPALSNLRKVVTEPVHLPHPHRRDSGHHRRPDAVAGGGRPEQQAAGSTDFGRSTAPLIGPPVGALNGNGGNGNGGNGNGNGNGLMAPVEPPRAVPPEEPLEPPLEPAP